MDEVLTFCPWSLLYELPDKCYETIDFFVLRTLKIDDATYCFIAAQFSQYCKHSESANLLRKLLLLHVWAGPKVKSLFVQAQSLLTF
jgi:hypothetical protein